MKINRLQVTNLRAFEHGEFEFRPGMNLLVGINGVGKTTVLDALRICLSKILPIVTASRSRPKSFAGEDIRSNSKSLTINCGFELHGLEFSYLVHKQREGSVEHRPGVVREQTIDTPDKEECQPALSLFPANMKKPQSHPIGLFFSVRRSIVSDVVHSKMSAGGGQTAAFADALVSRGLRLAETAYWMRAQEELSREHPLAQKHISALRRAAKRFLPDCKNLRVEQGTKPRLIVDKQGAVLNVRQLSEGERGLLALVLDIARRLSQVNPTLSDPIQRGQGVVLIDELDLHLHPKWQRTIVDQLTQTFPNCQFIATTHSPQIVASVEPEQVLLLTDTGIIRPDRTLGMDSNWILRHLMEADDRPLDASKAIRKVEDYIKKGDLDKARAEIAAKRKAGLDIPEWAILEARMARLETLAE